MTGALLYVLKKSIIVYIVLIVCTYAQAIPRLEGAKDIGVDEKIGASIPLDLSFKDEEGNPVKLRTLFRDEKPVILTLSYYECRKLCTNVLNGVLDAVARLDSRYPGQDLKILTVSFSSTDTPELARQKAAIYHDALQKRLDKTDWRFLTGDENNIRTLTQAVGFRYKKYGELFTHSGVVIILSPQGKIVQYLHGTQYGTKELRLALLEASGKNADSVLYSLNTLRLGGLATLLPFGVLLTYFFLRKKESKV